VRAYQDLSVLNGWNANNGNMPPLQNLSNHTVATKNRGSVACLKQIEAAVRPQQRWVPPGSIRHANAKGTVTTTFHVEITVWCVHQRRYMFKSSRLNLYGNHNMIKRYNCCLAKHKALRNKFLCQAREVAKMNKERGVHCEHKKQTSGNYQVRQNNIHTHPQIYTNKLIAH